MLDEESSLVRYSAVSIGKYLPRFKQTFLPRCLGLGISWTGKLSETLAILSLLTTQAKRNSRLFSYLQEHKAVSCPVRDIPPYFLDNRFNNILPSKLIPFNKPFLQVSPTAVHA